ncbi:hypothetical protein [Lactobacillus xujianguonis]|uniref:hypothetical protein n=1 Tax=Lactobacillus xujianguonis TaxID=2495899 RepID=UPI000FD7E3DB|nr:hypothetical protein [Lactobacillus xujianguonis]RVU77551.1 hypothetical protein EJK20_00965 [Lactobacillus xujianguonis]
MNWKKIFLIFVVFLTFLGTGSILSNVQSREADQLLEAHGLSNNTRQLQVNSNKSVSSFLQYLNQYFKKNKIQLHLDNKNEQEQILVWANRNIIPLPTESGKYFSIDDFSGRVSFAVLGANSKYKTLKVQGNQYLLNHGHYYTVIGELKNFKQIERNKYYLSTGIDQPTAKSQLKNYRIVIDSSPKVIKKLARHYHTKVSTPEFVKQHQIKPFSVVNEIILILLYWIVAVIANLLIMMMQKRQITHLKGKLLRNWVILRLILIEGLLCVIAFLILWWKAFFKAPDHLILLLFLNWLIAVIAYLFAWYIFKRKGQKVVKPTN